MKVRGKRKEERGKRKEEKTELIAEPET